MISRTIGRRYAKAFMAVALERGESPEPLLAQLEGIAKVLGDQPRFGELLTNPKVLLADRLRSLERLLDSMQPPPLVRHLFVVLLRKGRLIALPHIIDEFRTLADVRAGVLRPTVTSATPLTPAETDELRRLLKQRFGKDIVLTLAVDPELIAGIVIRIGSLSFDGSIRSQLKAIHRQLLQEVTFS